MSTATLTRSTSDSDEILTASDEVLTGEIVGQDLALIPTPDLPALRSEYVDPTELVDNPRNLRTDIGDLADLKASMAVVGVLCPLVVIPVEGRDDVFQLIIGHRRKYAAIDLGMSQVPCWVAADEGAALQIVAQLAENGHRIGLTPTEEAEAFHQLTLLDWTPEQIAKVRAIPTAQVKQTLQLRALPQAARGAADAGALTLEDAAALAEFTEEPAALTRILKATGSAWGLRHAIASERSKRVFGAAKERLKAELVLAGVKVTGKPKGFPYSGVEVAAEALVDADGQRLDPDAVMTRPGFAAFVEKGLGDAARAVVYCTDPDRYGYTRFNRFATQLSKEELAKREEAERVHAEYLENLTLATTVRQDFYRKSYASARAAKRLFPEALRNAVADTGSIRFADADDLYTALGGHGMDVVLAAGEDRLRRCLVAQWICAHERNLGYAATERTWSFDADSAAFWLDQLVADGYTLSDAETTLRKSLHGDEEPDENTDPDLDPELDPDLDAEVAEIELPANDAAADGELGEPGDGQGADPEDGSPIEDLVTDSALAELTESESLTTV
ncbi:ParB family chromosome partitioning protein [Micromonospora pisi]|uniref:ParB family chromosome partitioning protein n=1 Tax=Micromonospora pisi TaxID=589240 RepID=A0A495JIC0_9ACTN|nr:ParB/RepB/Spo0J family partition protein [Micromonospora pisi]RKR88308.1 ParB family chromosome partitioning protein [Micromonospora pisi]